MKKILLSAAILFGLCGGMTQANDAPAPGNIVYNTNMFAPGDSSPAFKKAANEQYGTQWYFELDYGFWALDNAMPGYTNTNHLAILYAILNQRLIKDDINGGTWLRMDVAGSWGLDHDSANSGAFYVNGIGMCSGLHTDILGPHDLALLEVSVKHFFANKRACLTAGMIKLNNYMDRIGHARFTNDNFESSGVLPMPYNNLAAVLQVELDRRNWVTGALTRMGTPWGSNPFNAKHANGYAIVGEYGHITADSKATFRVSPFFCSQDTPGLDGRDHQHNAVGIFGSVEYQLNDIAKVYARAGMASSEYQRCSRELSAGTTLRLTPSRPNDYMGLGFGIFTGAETDTTRLTNKYEKVLECMYRVQLNQYFFVAPYFQFIMTPAYRDVDHASATGIQAGITF